MTKENDTLVDWLCRSYGLRLDRAKADAIEIAEFLARDGFAIVPIKPSNPPYEITTAQGPVTVNTETGLDLSGDARNKPLGFDDAEQGMSP